MMMIKAGVTANKTLILTNGVCMLQTKANMLYAFLLYIWQQNVAVGSVPAAWYSRYQGLVAWLPNTGSVTTIGW